MIRVANFVLDEKFIDSQIDYQDTTCDKCQHDYYLVNDKFRSFKFIKLHQKRVRIISPAEAIKIANEYDAVFLHTIFGMPIHLIHQINHEVKVFWFAWGFDIYSYPLRHPLVRIDSFKPLTNNYIKKDFKSRVFEIVFYLYTILKRRGRHYYKKAISRVDYFAGVLPEEYEMVKENNLKLFKAKQVDYSYAPMDYFYKQERIEKNLEKQHPNIIIGNSTAYENNHLDVLEILRDIPIGDRKIYVPLSYSPNPDYVSFLKERGENMFGASFVAITNFLPLKEYQAILESCGYAIFATERQMALGNIINCLKSGAKVFLCRGAVIYKHFINLGAKVFTVEDDLNKIEAFEPLSQRDIAINRRIICEQYNEERLKKKLYNLYNLI